MSLHSLIMSLLSGILDPVTRVDIASTIHYIFDIYSSGNISDADAKNALFEICVDVLRATKPDLTDEEIKENAEQLSEQFIKAFRIEALRRRMLSRFRSRMPI